MKGSLGGVASGMNKSFDIAHQNNNVLKFDDLMNTSIDLITNKIQSKHNKSRDRSPSVPKLDFKQVKELQEQAWMAYSKKLEDSIKVLNQRIVMIEDEKDKIMQKYNKLAANNTKLYELNERLNQMLKELKGKMKETKASWKEKVEKARENNAKVCQFCHNMVEMSMGMSQFTMTYDKVNVSFDTSLINNSFHNSKGSFMKQGAQTPAAAGADPRLPESQPKLHQRRSSRRGSGLKAKPADSETEPESVFELRTPGHD